MHFTLTCRLFLPVCDVVSSVRGVTESQVLGCFVEGGGSDLSCGREKYEARLMSEVASSFIGT